MFFDDFSYFHYEQFSADLLKVFCYSFSSPYILDIGVHCQKLAPSRIPYINGFLRKNVCFLSYILLLSLDILNSNTLHFYPYSFRILGINRYLFCFDMILHFFLFASFLKGNRTCFTLARVSGSFLNFLNLHHIFNFLAVRTPEIFHVTGCSHSATRFSGIRNISAFRALKNPDFIFVFSHLHRLSPPQYSIFLSLEFPAEVPFYLS